MKVKIFAASETITFKDLEDEMNKFLKGKKVKYVLQNSRSPAVSSGTFSGVTTEGEYLITIFYEEKNEENF